MHSPRRHWAIFGHSGCCGGEVVVRLRDCPGVARVYDGNRRYRLSNGLVNRVTMGCGGEAGIPHRCCKYICKKGGSRSGMEDGSHLRNIFCYDSFM